MHLFASVIRDERGAAAVEYGLIAAFIVVAMVFGLMQLATSTTAMWNAVEENVSSAH